MQRRLIRNIETKDSWPSNPIHYCGAWHGDATSVPDLVVIRYSFENYPMLTGSLPYDMFTIFQSKDEAPRFQCLFNSSNDAAQAFVERFKKSFENLKLTAGMIQLTRSSIHGTHSWSGWDLMISHWLYSPSRDIRENVDLFEEMKKIINLFLETSGITDEAIKEMLYADMEDKVPDKELTLASSFPLFSSSNPVEKTISSSSTMELKR